MENKTIRVTGMRCAHCKRAVESMVRKLSGVETVAADVDSGTVTVSYNAEQVDTEAIEGAIVGAGCDILG
ncbi:MAG: heavy-metal-associated domain-containing protein [Firmicutes bacterium]|nr:heavy-metal-associated domain-containing protein [Bacillota bacterium]